MQGNQGQDADDARGKEVPTPPLRSGVVSPAELARCLRAPVARILAGRGEVADLRVRGSETVLPDSTLKLVAVDHRGRPTAFILAGTPVGKNLVARSLGRARAARDALGVQLARAVLAPVGAGVALDHDYAVFPYCRALAESGLRARVERRWLRSALVNWLTEATKKTRSDPLAGESACRFAEALDCLATRDFVSGDLRERAAAALGRLRAGAWTPRHVLTHFDFWAGNVLWAPRPVGDEAGRGGGQRFVVVDWAGSVVDGFAFFDLVRLAISFRLTKRSLRREVAKHCGILECEWVDAESYLMSAFGHLAANIEHFPKERFRDMCHKCLSRLETLHG